MAGVRTQHRPSKEGKQRWKIIMQQRSGTAREIEYHYAGEIRDCEGNRRKSAHVARFPDLGVTWTSHRSPKFSYLLGFCVHFFLHMSIARIIFESSGGSPSDGHNPPQGSLRNLLLWGTCFSEGLLEACARVSSKVFCRVHGILRGFSR